MVGSLRNPPASPPSDAPSPGRRRPGRPPSFGFCTLCGQKVLRSRAILRYPGAYLCPACGRDDGERTLRTHHRLPVKVDRNEPLSEEADGMVRKNLTITTQEDEFLQRHREINQSALFRRAIVSLMQAESAEVRRNRRGSPPR